MRRLIILAPIVLALNACIQIPEKSPIDIYKFEEIDRTPLSEIDKKTLLTELLLNKEKWKSHSISSYRVRMEDVNCFCLYGPYYGPNQIKVRKGEIVSVIYGGEIRDGFRPGDQLIREKALKNTIEDVFDRIERYIYIDRHETLLTVEYDPKYGFPTLVDYDRYGWSDAQHRLIVSNFRPK
jgi:hypothetical protein